MMKFSIIIPVYNEERRISRLLKSIEYLSDDILIINKSSTDATVQVIRMLELPNVRLNSIPYREKGDDDFSLYASYALHDWIFIMVASEIAPEGFGSDLKSKLKSLAIDSIDVVMIPRLYYCFGYHVTGSPWDISHFPFLFNRKTVIFSGVPHEHVRPQNEGRRAYIHFAKDLMIRHYTHTNVDSFMRSVIGYGDLEVSREDLENSISTMVRSIRNIWLAERMLRSKPGVPALMHFSAWNIHWSYQILKRCDRLLQFGSDVHEEVSQYVGPLARRRFLIKSLVDRAYIIFKVYFEGWTKKNGLFSKIRLLKNHLKK